MGPSVDCFQNNLVHSAKFPNHARSNLFSAIVTTCLLVVSFQQPVHSQTELTVSTGASNSITIESQAHYSFSVPGADVTRNGASEAVMIYDQNDSAREPQSIQAEIHRGNSRQRLIEQSSVLPPASVSSVDSSAHM